jgi:hypothetical protein
MSQAMKKMRSLFALIPAVALAAACSGPSATAPSDLGPSALLASNDSGTVTAMTTSPCAGIVKIDLEVADTSRTVLWVEATYRFDRSNSGGCPAPAWSSDRSDMIVDSGNPFRAGFKRSANGSANLTAKAANGVHNTIRLQLGPGRTCASVVGVDLRLLPSKPDGMVWIQAAYKFLGDTPDECREPPKFTASRAGLQLHPGDAFRVGIKKDPGNTTVAAAAPNGVGNKIQF